MTLTIRPATPADRVALDEQEQGLNLFEEQFTGNRRLDRAGAVAAMDQLSQRAANTNGCVLVAELDGAVIAHLVLTFERSGAYVREDLRDHGHVADLFVRAAHRGQGIGTALLREAERRTTARGIPRLTIGVVTGNTNAEHAYRRFGFSSYAMEMAKDLQRK